MQRILYLGQKPIGEKCFFHLLTAINSDFKISAVVTNSEKIGWWDSNRIWQYCQDIFPDSCFSNRERNNDFILQKIKSEDINTIISVQHPWILSQEIIDAVKGRCYNMHMAKLPDYKGHNSFSHAILNGDKKYTTTIHYLVKNADEGDIIFEDTFPIEDYIAEELYHVTEKKSLLLFQKFIDYLKDGKRLPRKHQTGKGVFYKRNSLESLKEVKRMADIYKRSYALYFKGYEPAYIKSNDKKIYLIPEL